MNANQPSSEEEQKLQFDEEPHEPCKPILPKCPQKTTPIGLDLHQVQVPPLITLSQLRAQREHILAPIQRAGHQAVFKSSRIDSDSLDKYLQFVDEYIDQKDPQYYSQGSVSRERLHDKALTLLHTMNYNCTKARFFVIFPYYLYYNRYRSYSQINISDAEMESKINEHLESLRSSKTKDVQRWMAQLEALVETKVNLNRVNQLIDQGKQLKCEVPEVVREQIEKANKLGKDLKKMFNTKVSIDRLLQRRESLSEQKIMTNQIISFQETVQRCEEWIVKASKFQEKYFIEVLGAHSSENGVKQVELRREEKIEFKQINLLVQQYNNLPVLYPPFESNTKKLYESTTQLLDRLPLFIKTARTRTNNQAKLSYKNLLQLIDQVENHPVTHPDFENFDRQAHQSMQQIERIGMCLEDSKFDKNVKIMSGYLKLTSDMPIQTSTTVKLDAYIDYTNMIDKIKKDIGHQQRLEGCRTNINELKGKGFMSQELLDLERRLNLYDGWFQSAEIIRKADSTPSIVELIRNQAKVLGGLIEQESFCYQFEMARRQLIFQPNAVEQYTKHLELIQQQKQDIRALLAKPQPSLNELIEKAFYCIRLSLKYPQLLALIKTLRNYLSMLCKMRYVLDFYQGPSGQYFIKKEEYDGILDVLAPKKQLKEFQYRHGEALLQQAHSKPFPRALEEFGRFKEFVEGAKDWQNRTIQFIRKYQSSSDFDSDILEKLLEQTSGILYEQQIVSRLQEINYVSKWKHNIETKLEDNALKGAFDAQDTLEIIKITMQTGAFEKRTDQDLKVLALEYLKSKRETLSKLMSKIAPIQIERTHKLPQLTKLLKQIEKLQINDQKLTELKKDFASEISNCEKWKERCMTIRKADRRRAARGEDDQEGDEGNKKTTYKGNQFGYYFKLPLLIIELFNATKLKIVLEELNKLKNSIQETYLFMMKAREFQSKEKPNFSDLINLEIEGNKLNIFSIEFQVIKRRAEYAQSWKVMANNIIDSMMILRLQQLTVTKPPTQSLPQQVQLQKPPMISNNMQSQNHGQSQQRQQKPAQTTEQPSTKRKRKQNPLYNNDEITLLVEDMYSPKVKKRRKSGNEGGGQRRTKAQTRKQNKNEQMQKQVEEYYENPSSYCICRMGLMNESSFMIECEKCLTWFHTECIGIRKSYVKSVGQSYYCVACTKLRKLKKPDYQHAFFWQSHTKMTEQMFNTLVQEGEQLSINIDELSRLQTLQTRIENWKTQVSKLIDQLWANDNDNTDSTTQQSNGRNLFDLYLQSFWLPTMHLETDVLECFLQRHI